MKPQKHFVLMLIILSASFSLASAKIEPGVVQSSTGNEPAPAAFDKAAVQTIIEWYEAVGTIRPRTESGIEAQVPGQVTDVKVRPGDKVQKGQILVSLDSRQFQSRVDQARQGMKGAAAGKEQARQGVIAAQAAFKQAESDYKRTQSYFNSQAATKRELEAAESAYLQAKAGLSRAQEALTGAEAGIRQAGEMVKEAEIGTGYTTIRAPESGEVLKRMVEPGDMAMPGKPLIMLQTAGSLRMEAYVREGMINKVKPGDALQVSITTLNITADATVEEVVPYADPQSRSFLVKTSLPTIPGLFPGMFGKLLIPIQQQQVIVIPETAVLRVGQLEMVSVKEGEVWKRRFVKVGKKIGDKVEVLSGLSGNETVGIKEAK